MRRFLFLLTVILSVPNAEAAERTAIFSVENMTCVLCPITVRTVMERVSGVKEVQVDFESKKAMVVFDDTQTTVEDIAEASRQAGFPAVLKE